MIPLYGDDYIQAYKRKKIDSPHVYAIADTAIREMIRGFLDLSFEVLLSDFKFYCFIHVCLYP